jgi:hypothetical protein
MFSTSGFGQQQSLFGQQQQKAGAAAWNAGNPLLPKSAFGATGGPSLFGQQPQQQQSTPFGTSLNQQPQQR